MYERVGIPMTCGNLKTLQFQSGFAQKLGKYLRNCHRKLSRNDDQPSELLGGFQCPTFETTPNGTISPMEFGNIPTSPPNDVIVTHIINESKPTFERDRNHNPRRLCGLPAGHSALPRPMSL